MYRITKRTGRGRYRRRRKYVRRSGRRVVRRFKKYRRAFRRHPRYSRIDYFSSGRAEKCVKSYKWQSTHTVSAYTGGGYNSVIAGDFAFNTFFTQQLSHDMFKIYDKARLVRVVRYVDNFYCLDEDFYLSGSAQDTKLEEWIMNYIQNNTSVEVDLEKTGFDMRHVIYNKLEMPMYAKCICQPDRTGYSTTNMDSGTKIDLRGQFLENARYHSITHKLKLKFTYMPHSLAVGEDHWSSLDKYMVVAQARRAPYRLNIGPVVDANFPPINSVNFYKRRKLSFRFRDYYYVEFSGRNVNLHDA